MEKNIKSKFNSSSSKWWQPNRTEYIMLTVAVLTLLISILAQINALLESAIKIGEVYEQLYPLLNTFHIFVILYSIFQMQNIKKQLPDSDIKTNDAEYTEKAKNLVENLKKWIFNYIGNFYYNGHLIHNKKEKIEYNRKKEKIKYNKRQKRKNIENAFVKELVTTTNTNINKLYTYWCLIWIWLLALYVFEFIKSTYDNNNIILASLGIVFNNLFNVYWFFIYLKLNNPNEIKLTQNDIAEITGNKYTKKKRRYKRNKFINAVKRFFNLSNAFGKGDKYKKYESGKESGEEIEIPQNFWKIIAWSIFSIIVILLAFHVLGKMAYDWCENFSRFGDGLYNFIMYISVLLGACSMLAAFSRLGSGFFRIPLSALLIMLFYSAVQPLFFADKDLLNDELKSGQLLFVINFILLIGKFALLYIIKWIFSDYRIAYYFINEQIIQKKSDSISDDKVRELFEKANTV